MFGFKLNLLYCIGARFFPSFTLTHSFGFVASTTNNRRTKIASGIISRFSFSGKPKVGNEARKTTSIAKI